jgi:two-component system sensor histidine kinase UhpB
MDSLQKKQNPDPVSMPHTSSDLSPTDRMNESHMVHWQKASFISIRESANQNEQDHGRPHGNVAGIAQAHNEQHEPDSTLARLKAILSNIPGLVFECTLNENNEIVFIYLNEGCQALLDLTPEQMNANPHLFIDMILPADRKSFLASMQASAASLNVWNWEGGLWMEKWQDVKSVNLCATASRIRQGKVLWSGIITNITQSHNEKMALDEITNRFKAIVSNIPSLVFQCALDNNNELVFNYLSDACYALLGAHSDTLFKQPEQFIEIILPEDRESFFKSMHQSAANRSAWNWEGGLWIKEWQDIKLVNLRASAMLNAQGQVQWCGLITNITQSKKEKQELERSNQQLEELSSHMALVKEQERLHIAREIHDNIGGNLTAIKIGLSSLIKGLEKQQPALIEKAMKLEALVDSTFDDTHKITADLRPGVLELGIVAALEWHAKEFENSMGIPVSFKSNEESLELDMDCSIVLFRVCQEANTNTAKYAKAESIKIELIHQADEIVLQISDDGIGIKPEDKLKRNAFGLRGMVERVQAVDGQISIEPGLIAGTQILVRLPYNPCYN